MRKSLVIMILVVFALRGVAGDYYIYYEGSSACVSVDTTFVNGSTVTGSLSVAYGSVGVVDCQITANGAKVINATENGSTQWMPPTDGEYKLVYSSGVTMETKVGMVGVNWPNIRYVNLHGATHTNPGSYQEGTAVAFTPPSGRIGYTFTGWTPAAITADMTGAQDVAAGWRVNAYQIVYFPNGGSGTMETVNCKYDQEDLISTKETKREYYTNKD